MTKENDIKNFIWNFLGVSMNSFNSFFFFVIANRINGVYQAGIFTYSFSLICLLYMIGIYYGRVYQVSDVEKKYTNKEYIYNRIITCFIMIIVAVILCIILKYDRFKTSVILLLCLFRAIEAFSDVFYGILQKEKKLYQSGFSLFIKGLLGLIAFFLIDYFTKNIILSCVSLIFVNLFIFLIYDVNKSKEYIQEGSFKKSLEIFKHGFFVFLFSFLGIYLANFSKYFLDFFGTTELQNVFGIILMPATVLSLVSQYLINPFLLKLTDFYEKEEWKKFNSQLFTIVKYIVLIGIVGIIAAYFMGIPFLNFVYKIDLTEYKFPLILIIIGAIFCSISYVISAMLTILKNNKVQMYIHIVSSILSIFISIILIKKYLIIGSSLAYCIIMLIHCSIYYIIYKRTLSYEINKRR